MSDNATDFQTWLQSRNIDAEQLVPEMRRALLAQFQREVAKSVPPAHSIVALEVDSERWPQRCYRSEVLG